MGSSDKPNFLVNFVYKKKHIAKGRYKLYQGQRSERKLPQGKVCGFLNKDIVSYRKKIYLIKGLMSTGYCTLMDIDGNKQVFTNPKTVKLNRLRRVSARSTTRCVKQSI